MGSIWAPSYIPKRLKTYSHIKAYNPRKEVVFPFSHLSCGSEYFPIDPISFVFYAYSQSALVSLTVFSLRKEKKRKLGGTRAWYHSTTELTVSTLLFSWVALHSCTSLQQSLYLLDENVMILVVSF